MARKTRNGDIQPHLLTPTQQAALLLALEALAIAATGDIWKLATVDRERMREAGKVVREMVENGKQRTQESPNVKSG